jgi:hypothetical protein
VDDRGRREERLVLLGFDSRQLRTNCENPPPEWPSPGDHEFLIDRLADLLAAENLASMPVGVVWEGITPEHVIISVSERCRLVCRSNHVAIRRTDGGDPDWAATTRLYVENVQIDGRSV